jgi:chromate transport protein ChrA
MNRERALKVLLVLVGLLFVAGLYPLLPSLLNPHSDVSSGDKMMLSIYVTLGIFVLLAVRNPSAHRSLIAFTAWSSFAHGAVMAILAVQTPVERTSLLVAVGVLGFIGVALLALAPARQPAERAASAAA